MADERRFTRLEDEIEFTLLRSRRLFFSGGVSGDSARAAIRKLWYLELTGPGEPITIVINSPGGSVDAGYAIWDQIKMMESPVSTLVTGMAASMGSVLALCAPKGRRFATEHARFMIHQPSIPGGIQGPAADIEIHAVEIVKMRDKIADMYVEATGQSKKVVEKALDRDTWMGPEEALDFGLIDKIVKSYKDL